MNNVSIKQFKNAIDTMLNGYIDGVSYIPLSKTDDDKTIALVLGYELGYNDGEDYQVKVGNDTYAEDLTWFLSQAEEMINLMNKGVLTI